MKWIFFLLLLANLALAAWGRLGREAPPNPLTRQELHADLIKQLAGPTPPMPVFAPLPASAPVPAAAPIPAPAPAPAPKPASAQVLACYRWGVFSGNADAAKNAIAVLAPSASVAEHGLSKTALGFWVYLPPAKSRSEGLAEIRKLNDMGIKDHFLVQESGKWQYAVSLGIFHTEEAAKNYAASLRNKGLNSAKSAGRDGGGVELLIRNFPVSKAANLAGKRFPKTKLEKTDCRPIGGKASPD